MTPLDLGTSLGGLNLLALACIVFIGLPHGAMDGALALHLGWLRQRSKAAAFLLSYVGLAAAVVFAWVVAPVLTFVVFLGISLFHFGRGDVNEEQSKAWLVESFARGGLVIAGISQFHRVDADLVFQSLVGSDTGLVWLFLDAVSVVVAASIVFVGVRKSGANRRSYVLETVGLGILFAVTPPLFGFAVYFCLVHSSRHFQSMKEIFGEALEAFEVAKPTVVLTLITWAAGIAALAVRSSDVALNEAVLQVVFIGLAALTVPHMMLVDGVAPSVHASHVLKESITRGEVRG